MISFDLNAPISRAWETARHSMLVRLLLLGCFTCASVLMLGTGRGQVQELVSARVLSSEGPVEIRRPSSGQPQIQKIAYKTNEELKAGDTIVTGKSGHLVLGLSDGSQAVIAPQTTVVIKDLSQSPRTLFNVIRGKTRIHIEKLGGQPNPYRVNTPTAVIAVRGTIFDVLVSGDETQVFLQEGEVAVTNLMLPDRPVILLAGQMTRIASERPPNPPSTFKVGRNDETFKSERQDGPAQGNRRSTASNQRSEAGHNGQASNGGMDHNSGRGGMPSNGGTTHAGGRNGPPSMGGMPSGGPGSNGSGSNTPPKSGKKQ